MHITIFRSNAFYASCGLAPPAPRNRWNRVGNPALSAKAGAGGVSRPPRHADILTIYPGADGSFTYYDDDGLTFAYERGDFQAVDLTWKDAAGTLTLTRHKASRREPLEFQVRLVAKEAKTVKLVGDRLTISLNA